MTNETAIELMRQNAELRIEAERELASAEHRLMRFAMVSLKDTPEVKRIEELRARLGDLSRIYAELSEARSIALIAKMDGELRRKTKELIDSEQRHENSSWKPDDDHERRDVLILGFGGGEDDLPSGINCGT